MYKEEKQQKTYLKRGELQKSQQHQLDEVLNCILGNITILIELVKELKASILTELLTSRRTRQSLQVY